LLFLLLLLVFILLMSWEGGEVLWWCGGCGLFCDE
jgi:hypothetical protein